ncbi:MAG: bifunctional riboflavin kinase/FAD synthetase [Pseudomonadota bacterium]|nr:bifunctional riboflavin kinase/FAD synthetase [Pseudomonadota bacterium]
MTRVYAGSTAWPADQPGPVVAIGNFDGIHDGHRAVLRQLFALAAREHAPSCVLTFDPAPTAVLAPERHQPRILTLEDRVRLLGEEGVDAVVIEPFTRAFAAQPAQWFAEELLGRRLRVRGVVVGYDFRFGHLRQGDVASLREWLPRVPISEVEAEAAGGTPVSSSRVRRLVASGDVAEAAVLLGRPHFLPGTVVHGDHRGRTIGFPTANVETRVELLPAYGVYAVRVRIDGGAERLPGVANIGVRPTFGGTAPRIEVHLFDYAGDLYGHTLSVELIARVRGEQRFDGVDALVAQIRQDAQRAREILA